MPGRLSSSGFKWEIVQNAKKLFQAQRKALSQLLVKTSIDHDNMPRFMLNSQHSYRNLKSHIYTEMHLINIFKKKINKTQFSNSYFFFTMAAITQQPLVQLSCSCCCFIRIYFHTQQFGLLFSTQALKKQPLFKPQPVFSVYEIQNI